MEKYDVWEEVENKKIRIMNEYGLSEKEAENLATELVFGQAIETNEGIVGIKKLFSKDGTSAEVPYIIKKKKN